MDNEFLTNGNASDNSWEAVRITECSSAPKPGLLIHTSHGIYRVEYRSLLKVTEQLAGGESLNVVQN